MGNSLGDLGHQATEVFRHFAVQQVGTVQPQPGTHPQLITGRICAFGRYFVAPLNGSPCVYHETIATEDIDNGTVRIKEGNIYVDFCIGDPASPDFLFIPASTAKIVLIRADAVTTTTGHETFIDKPIPPNIQVFADRHNFPLTVPGAVFGQTMKSMTYTESSLDLNEQITVLGIVTIGIRPSNPPLPPPSHSPLLSNTRPLPSLLFLSYSPGPGPNGMPVKILQPMTANMLNEEYFNLTGWSSLDRKCWSSLMSDQPSIIMGDAPYLFQNHKISPTKYVPPAGGQIYAMQSQGGNNQPHMMMQQPAAGQPMMMMQSQGGNNQPHLMMQPGGGQPMMMMQPNQPGTGYQNQPILMQGAPGRYGGSGGLQPQGYYPPGGQPQQTQPMNYYPPGHPQHNTQHGVGGMGGNGMVNHSKTNSAMVPAGLMGTAVGFLSGHSGSIMAGSNVAGNAIEAGAMNVGREIQQQWGNAQPGLAQAGQEVQAGHSLSIISIPSTHTHPLNHKLFPRILRC